jgi:hypothetical protein
MDFSKDSTGAFSIKRQESHHRGKSMLVSSQAIPQQTVGLQVPQAQRPRSPSCERHANSELQTTDFNEKVVKYHRKISQFNPAFSEIKYSDLIIKSVKEFVVIQNLRKQEQDEELQSVRMILDRLGRKK